MIHAVELKGVFDYEGSVGTFTLPSFIKRVKGLYVYVENNTEIARLLDTKQIKRLGVLSLILNNDSDFAVTDWDIPVPIYKDAGFTLFRPNELLYNTTKIALNKKIQPNALHKAVIKSFPDVFENDFPDYSDFLGYAIPIWSAAVNLYLEYE